MVMVGLVIVAGCRSTAPGPSGDGGTNGPTLRFPQSGEYRQGGTLTWWLGVGWEIKPK